MKRTLTTILSLLLILSLTLTLAACGSDGSSTPAAGSEADGSTIGSDESGEESGGATGEADYTRNKLACSIPLTGNNMQYGIAYQNALNMAVDEFNAAGGLNGTDVVLEIFDDKGDQKEALNIANKIIEDPAVFAALGSFGSSVSMAAAPVYQKAGVPFVSPNTSHDDFPGMGDMMIPISPTAEIEKNNSSGIYLEAFDKGPLAIINQNTDLGVRAVEIITEYYEAGGGSITTVETFVPNETKDFTPLLSKIKATEPAALYIEAEYNDGAAIIIQAMQMGFEDIRLCSTGQMLKPEFLGLVGDLADGMIVCASTPSFEPSIMGTTDFPDYVVNFVDTYTALYPDTPVDGFAAACYDGAMLAMVSARNVGTADSKVLVEEMLRCPIESVCGLGMHYETDDNSPYGNSVYKELFVYQVEGDTFKNYGGGGGTDSGAAESQAESEASSSEAA